MNTNLIVGSFEILQKGSQLSSPTIAWETPYITIDVPGLGNAVWFSEKIENLPIKIGQMIGLRAFFRFDKFGLARLYRVTLL